MNKILQLVNPKTQHYIAFKKYVMSSDMTWFRYTKQQEDNYHNYDIKSKSLFQHPKMNLNKMGDVETFISPFLGRPTSDEPYPHPQNSLEYIEGAVRTLKEILDYNKLEVNSFLRVAANMVYPDSKVDTTFIHVDHHCPHKNMLVYLTDSGGETIVENDYHDPKEDDAIIFEGYHTHNVPKTKARIVLVATFV